MNNKEHHQKNKPVLRLRLSREQAPSLFAFVGIFSVLVGYVFFASFGTWTNWTTGSTYYDQLAASFTQGKLSLERTPDAALLALPNPYDPEARAGIPYPQDVSLYKGKFYLYFGPIPAVMLAVIKPFFQREISDLYLVFAFALGILWVESWLIVRIWKKFHSDILPSWLILPVILVIGLTSPFGRILSQGSMHNVAILGGQFFFLAGLYVIFNELESASIPKSSLVLAGIFWACAIGSRVTEIVPVGFMLLMVLVLALYKDRRQGFLSRSSSILIYIGLPIFIGLIGLGWYNWARFDSVFETGLLYQLAGPNLQKYQQELFSPVYIPNNLYNYFLLKPGIVNVFPFLHPVEGYNESIIPFIDLPDVYFSQETAGLLYVAPFLLFVIPSVIMTVNTLRQKGWGLFNQNDNFDFNWTLLSLFGSCLLNLLLYLCYFWVGVRFQVGIMPTLIMLGILGFWQTYRHIASRPLLLYILIAVGLGLIMVTIVNSNLIALSINSAKYQEHSPALWRHLISFFQ